MINRIFAENVRETALKQGKRLGDFEIKCGVSVGYIAKAIKYNHWIPLETAVRFAKELGMSLEELCKE